MRSRSRLPAAPLCCALLLTLSACASPQPSQPSPAPTAPVVSAPADPTPSGSGTPMLAAFRAALETIYNDHLYPNGDPVDVPEMASMENNRFAIFDVDLDGQNELLYENGDATTAGMMTTVFSWAENNGESSLLTELSGYPAMAFYDNGIATVQLSHNHGLAGNTDFWPYFLYRYDPGQDSYLLVAALDAWDGVTFPDDFGGESFPDDVDQDGDKVVYWISYPGQEVTYDLVDGPAYQEWLNGYLAGAGKLEIPWQNMTSENILAVAP